VSEAEAEHAVNLAMELLGIALAWYGRVVAKKNYAE
jgi:hypothetical protein